MSDMLSNTLALELISTHCCSMQGLLAVQYAQARGRLHALPHHAYKPMPDTPASSSGLGTRVMRRKSCTHHRQQHVTRA